MASQDKEYAVRINKFTTKKFNLMSFGANEGDKDFFKIWPKSSLGKEKRREAKKEDERPKFGAGSVYGQEQREEARRKRYGGKSQSEKVDNRPYLLNKGEKQYKGTKKGGVADNSSWFVFMQGKDGVFDAYPVEDWYDFQTVKKYKTLTSEQAEEEFDKRNKILNYFQFMCEKKCGNKDVDSDEEEGNNRKKKKTKKSMKLTELEDWVSSDDEAEFEDAEDGEEKKLKKPSKKRTNKKYGGKRKKIENDDDASCEEESDDCNEGREKDYVLTDSSDSDQENDELVSKQLSGVEEGDALRKLLESDEEDEEENEEEKKKKEEEQNKENNNDNNKEPTKKENSPKPKNSKADRKRRVEEIKNLVQKNAAKMHHQQGPEPKRLKMDPAVSSSSGSQIEQMEDLIRRVITRKPSTPTDLLRQLKKKFNVPSEQLTNIIASLLKKMNPIKRVHQGKMFLSLNP